MEHRRISDISAIVGRARETVSRYLCDIEGYVEEKEYRRRQGEENRRRYQKEWEAKKRIERTSITSESIRREHEVAVKMLSAEKY